MAALLVSRLDRFLRLMAATPFAYGEWDCAMATANWVRELTGVDPARDLRGRYRTLLGWRRIVKREGGLVAVMARRALAAGMAPADAASPGAIGVVSLPMIGEAAGIACARGWAFKMHDGLTVVSAKPLAVWSL